MSLTIDFAQAESELSSILLRLADPVPFFDFVGEHEKHSVRERIMHTKLDPDGEPWLPWSYATEAIRTDKGNAEQGLLWDSSALLNSINFEVDGAYGVDIGTNIWYAQKQQEGEGRVPARPYLGWETEILAEYAAVFVAYIDRGQI